ncbi:ECF-type sigma factor [Stieleria varia]|uniref:ECF-type sigma factor n=1 Tax=Stieleria varia TaxID=2528005 RepID=UPI0018D2274A|nr:ECF-type sigma factor [Stieleria varia]
MATEPQSITVLFDNLRQGHADAAERLWNRFFDSLVRFAREQMSGANRRVADEEDIATGVMTALCARADRGTLPEIDNRTDLWHMLLAWTRHDIIDHVRRDQRIKRGSGKVRGDSVFDRDGVRLESLLSHNASPDILLEMEEQYQRLLNRLPDPVLRTIALEKMNGTTNVELANHLGIAVRTIERKLDLIRRHWSTWT